MRHRCPHCGESCMSSLQKLFISPANSTSCRSCGQGVTLRWKHYLLVIGLALAVLVFLDRQQPGTGVMIAVGAAMLLLAGLVQLALPLVKDRY